MPGLGWGAKRALKNAAIRTGLEAVAQSRVAKLWPSAAGRGIIFTLHNVTPATDEPFSPNALLSVTPDFLREALDRCREGGLTPVHLHALPALLSNRDDRRKFVCFTLDDGYRDNRQYAAPLFAEHAVPFTVFVTAGFIDRSRSMWWRTVEALIRERHRLEFDFGAGPEVVETRSTSQKWHAFERFSACVATGDEDDVIRRIDQVASGHGIDPVGMVDGLTMDEGELSRLAANPLAALGAHTVTHVNLRRVGPERLAAELKGSSEAVERIVGRRPASFCYPYGSKAAAGDREFLAAAEAGFAVAVTTQPGMIDERSMARRTALPRVSLNGLYQKARYVDAMISGVPFKLTSRRRGGP